MDAKSLREEARKRLNGACRVCAVCDGRACAGELPGMGGAGTGASFKENVRALAERKLNLRTIHGVRDPDTRLTFLGMPLSTPIMAAPMCNSVANAGGGLSEREMVEALVGGAQLAGSLGWIGDPADPGMYAEGLSAVEKAGRGVVIIKPRVDTQAIWRLFEQARNAGATALGVDIDGAGLQLMKKKGCAVEPKTPSQIAELARGAGRPFIVKGVMTADEARLCAEAGVSAIVVSNHGGRVLDHTPGTASVLPHIADAAKGRLPILVDGGIRSGADVLKMLALGADGVLIGRPLIVGAYGGGAEGVRFLLEKYAAELHAAMIMTGTAGVAGVSQGILALPGQPA